MTTEPYRVSQIQKWIWDRRATSLESMTDLPMALRSRLVELFDLGLPEIVERTSAEDGASKFLLAFADGAWVEAVHIPMAGRATICVSSQAGCALDCAFCVTGRTGAGRNLTAGEIAGQYLTVVRETRLGPHEANVVFMGMGEPLLNVANLDAALDLLGREVSPRRITVSTAGIVPGIEALAARERRPNLAVSLSAPDDETRTRLMPINRTWPIATLFQALEKWPLEPGRRITFEYVLIAGVNDSERNAIELARLVRTLPSKVNLIPLNESAEWLPALRRPKEEIVDLFARTLASAGVPVTVRWSKGLGASAACGQLKGRETPRRPPRRR